MRTSAADRDRAQHATQLRVRKRAKYAAFGRHTGPRSGLNLVKSGSANDWSGIEGEEGVGVGRNVTTFISHFCRTGYTTASRTKDEPLLPLGMKV